jgi:WD40 repeat protein
VTTNLLAFPDELTLRIFHCLDQQDLATVSRVCRQWHKIAEDVSLWRRHVPPGYFPHGGDPKTQARLFAHYVHHTYKTTLLNAHAANVECFLFKGAVLISGDASGTLHTWAPPASHPVATRCTRSPITILSSLYNELFSGHEDGSVRAWTVDTLTPTRTLESPHAKEVLCLLETEEKVISAGDRDIKIRDRLSGASVRTLNGHEALVTTLSLADSSLFSGSQDGTIKKWDIGTGTCTHTLSGNTSPVTSLTCHKDRLFSCSEDMTVRVWHAATGVALKTLSGHQTIPFHAWIHRNRLISCSPTELINWDLDTFQAQHIAKTDWFGATSHCSTHLLEAYLFKDRTRIHVRDYSASIEESLKEIAQQFAHPELTEEERDQLLTRFKGVPKRLRHQIYEHLSRLKNLHNTDAQCGKLAFFEQQGATGAERAQAIYAFLTS